MPLSAFKVAQKICSLSDWSVTNLQLQKLLYLCNFFFMGKNRERLILEPFEAWRYGPVSPAVYNRVKIFKDRPVLNIFYGSKILKDDDAVYKEEAKFISDIYGKLARISASKLVSMTHLKNGAWEKAYIRQINSSILDEDIIQEYRDFYKDEH